MKNNIYDLCIIGLGPAGIGLALLLYLSNNLHKDRVVIIEKGYSINDRILQSTKMSTETNNINSDIGINSILSGFGGCSLFSANMISEYPAGSKLAEIIGSEEKTIKEMNFALGVLKRYLPLKKIIILEELVQYKEKLLSKKGYKHKHYDSYFFLKKDIVRAYENFETTFVENASVLFNSCAQNVTQKNNHYVIHVVNQAQKQEIRSKKIVIATGKSGNSLTTSLNNSFKGIISKPSCIDYGVRLDFPIKSLKSEYHKVFDKTDLKLIKGKSRTYCVCKYGKTIHYNLDRCLFTEGHRDHDCLTKNISMALMCRGVSSSINKDIYSSIINNYHLLKPSNGLFHETLEVFLANATCLLNQKKSRLLQVFPFQQGEDIKREVFYFAETFLRTEFFNQISVFGPEVDFRKTEFDVSPFFESHEKGLYIIGASTGKFRGILQSFMSGIICAKNILRQL